MTEKNSDPDDNSSVFILVAEELKRIVNTESEAIYSDAEKLSILLRQNLGSKYIREIFLLMAPIRAGILRQLLHVSDRQDLNRKLSSAIENLRSQTGYDKEELRCAVYSCAYALDKITQKEFYQINKLSRVSQSTNILQKPMEDVSQKPMEDVSQKPMEDVSQKPMEDVSPTSREDDEPPIVEDVYPEHVRVVTPTGLRSILSRNRVRIPIGIAVAAGIIALIIVTLNSSQNIVGDRPIAMFTVNPEEVFGGEKVILNAEGSTSGVGEIEKYDWSVGTNNGSVVKISQSVPRLELPTKPSPTQYLLNIQLIVENDKGLRSDAAKESILVEQDQIIFEFD